MQTRHRVYVALVAGVLCLLLSLIYRTSTVEPINDLFFPFCGASALLQGSDPYGEACLIKYQGRIYPPNPMTTVLVAVPFAALGVLGSIILWSCITGLLVFGLLKDGAWWRLLTLLSAPYWEAFLTLQWSPLILAIALLPALLPLAFVKPQTGLPVILTNMTWRRVVACGLFLAATLAVDMSWPLRWLAQIGSYDGYIPLLAFPVGMLLLLAIARWREKSAQFLLLMAIVPQRGIYDLLSLWSLLETPKQLIIVNGLSWLLYIMVITEMPIPFPILSVLLIYLPILAIILHISITKVIEIWNSLLGRMFAR
jgi:hypothetical protein